MLKKFLLLILFVSTLVVDAKEFTVASYNVENLFDLNKDGTEYEEYTPNTKLWNKKSFDKKIDNIVKVLNDLNGDIIALQEIESQSALETLLKKLPFYKYYKFTKKDTSSVGVALISKFPIVDSDSIDVDKYDNTTRNILKTTVSIDGNNLILFVNHWRSKRASESKRIVYAMALKKEIEKLSIDEDYIILGDLNSNYNEYHTFKFDQKLNDTTGVTGINQVLNTTIDKNFVKKSSLVNYTQKVHYNLWLELKSKERYSNFYRSEKNTPDNILLPSSLFDQKGISYIDNSFYVFQAEYLKKGNTLNRWNIFKAEGYSDHLPILAKFSTQKQNYDFLQDKALQLHTIDTLYQLEQVSDFGIKDIVVIYNNEKVAIVKHLDQKVCQKAIMIYNPPMQLKLGGVYDFTVEELETYHGLKEIKSVSNIEEKGEIVDYKKYYLDGNQIDLFDERFQNNIITNIEGIYKKGYLYFTYKKQVEKIKVYFKKDIKRPKDGDKLTIFVGHLGTYKTQIQIVLYSVQDYKVY